MRLMKTCILFLLFSVVTPVVRAQGDGEKVIEIETLKKKLAELERELDLVTCAGHFSFGKVDFEFCMRNGLVKQIEVQGKATVVSLSNRDGLFTVRRPDGGQWTLASQQLNKDKPAGTIKPVAMEAISVFGRKLTHILNVADYKVDSLGYDTKDSELVILKMTYLPGMSNFDWKDKSIQDKAPIFNEATIELDSKSKFRINGYQLNVSFENQKGQKNVRLRYDNSGLESIHIPSAVAVDYRDASGKSNNRETSECANLSRNAPPESEFTLEFYGLKTPKRVGNVNWLFVALFLAASIACVILGFRFFKRK